MEMTSYDIYVLILCVIVFLLLTALSVVCVGMITQLTLKLIRSGVEDEQILAEHRKKQNKKANKIIKIIDYAFSSIVCFVLVVVFISSFFVSCSEKADTWELPTAYRVVRTGSMATKNIENTYLVENALHDQIQTFDVIKTEKLPDEMELELYDIVVYEVDGMMIIHRIVEIEEPNETHPDCRYFRLQGDAVDSPDRFPVRYEQMHAIYRGDRAPFLGSFVLFMQSPAGWLCVMLILAAMVVTPILENVLQKEKDKRLMLYVVEEPVEEPEEVEPEVVQVEIPTVTATYATAGRMGEVNLGMLNEHFCSGEIVDIHTLKQERLIGKACKRVKILEGGKLDKALIVCADGFSEKACAAIVQAGGTVTKSTSSVAAVLSQTHPEASGGDQLD
jgi:signal peptidase